MELIAKFTYWKIKVFVVIVELGALLSILMSRMGKNSPSAQLIVTGFNLSFFLRSE